MSYNDLAYILSLFIPKQLVWPVLLAQELPRPQLNFPSPNLVFWNLFEFSAAEITLKPISLTF
jgi:hypothetical protein